MTHIALITGSSKRLGREISLFLAKNGWDLVLHYNISYEEVSKLQSEIVELGRNCAVMQADFSKPAELKPLIHRVFKSVGCFDLLINNAAVFENDSIESFECQNLIHHMQVNLAAPALLSSQYFLHIQKYSQNFSKKEASIINILDYCVLNPPSNFLSYTLSKMGLWEFTKLAASQMAPLVRVNGVGLSNTLKHPSQSSTNFAKSRNAGVLKEAPAVDELCNTINFILHNPSITGQLICIDQGKHMPSLSPLS